MNNLPSTDRNGLRIRNYLNSPRRSCREGWSASKTPSTAQSRWSGQCGSSELKIMQQQVGHCYASTTALYTSVSSDFRNRTLRAALDRSIQAALSGGAARGKGER